MNDRWPVGVWARVAHAFGLVVVYLVCLFTMTRLVAPRLLSDVRLSSASNAQFMFAVPYLAIEWGVVLVVGLFLVGRTTPSRIGWHAFRGRDVLLGSFGFAALWGILIAALAIAGELDAEYMERIFGFTLRQRLMFLVLGVSGAVTEESIYRGYMQPALIAKVGLVGGIVGTAVVFALAHFQFRPFQLALKIAAGLVLGVLRGRNRSLVRPGVAHVLTWVVLGDT